MSSATKTGLVSLFTLLVLIFTTVQGLIPTMPISNPDSLAILSAVIMFIVTGLTAAKQYLSAEIANKALRSSLIVVFLALLGGLNDMCNVIHFSGLTNQWIRFVITLASAILNVSSKVLYPSGATLPASEKSI